jgi:hypothetical protein
LLKQCDGVVSWQTQQAKHGHGYRITLNQQIDTSQAADRIARSLIEEGHALYELAIEQRDLESVFREVTEREELDHAA